MVRAVAVFVPPKVVARAPRQPPPAPPATRASIPRTKYVLLVHPRLMSRPATAQTAQRSLVLRVSSWTETEDAHPARLATAKNAN